MKKADTTELKLDFLQNCALEDEIYLQIDKLQALSALQTLVNTAEDITIPKKHSLHYSLILEEQLLKLRNQLDQLFD
jgi:hypothetical protein